MNQQQLACTTPWVGHLLSEYQRETGGLSDRGVNCHFQGSVINNLSSANISLGHYVPPCVCA